MLENISSNQIKTDTKISNSFKNASFKNFSISCNIYKGDYFLDSFNYFPITEDYKTFSNLFMRDQNLSYEHFFTDKFFISFKENIENYKNFNDVFLLGSSAANNYYSNLIQFLPRIFFNNNNNKIIIHRNSSNKFRKFIEIILKDLKINSSFLFLDDNFYKFTNSEIPQFFNLNNSIKILRNFLMPKVGNAKDKKIYVTREDSSYRKIINESDLITILRSNGYKVINPQLYEIHEQIKLFAEADKIISPYGSNLANIAFCKEGAKIYEIGPRFDNVYEKIFEQRYTSIANINKLDYQRVVSDTVDVEKHDKTAKKYINKKILENSNYYKNLIVKISDIEKILD